MLVYCQFKNKRVQTELSHVHLLQNPGQFSYCIHIWELYSQQHNSLWLELKKLEAYTAKI